MADTCLEAFYAIGANLLQVELKGMFHPCRKSPDTGKANKMKKEEAPRALLPKLSSYHISHYKFAN